MKTSFSLRRHHDFEAWSVRKSTQQTFKKDLDTFTASNLNFARFWLRNGARGRQGRKCEKVGFTTVKAMFWRGQALPLGPKSEKKPIRRSDGISTGFWHPRHLVLVPFRRGFWEPESAKKGEKGDPDFGRDFDRKIGTAA